MYQIDEKDRVSELVGIPQSSVGAPMPIIVAEEGAVAVAYYLQQQQPDWDGTAVRIVDHNGTDEPVAIAYFSLCKAYYSGSPNDEAFSGHPLASRGLEPYGAFEVHESSWIREMERRNSVHPSHRGRWLEYLRHFVLAFHDSVFECVAKDLDVTRHQGSVSDAVPIMTERLFSR